MIIIDNYQSFRKVIFILEYIFILLLLITASYAALKDIKLIVLLSFFYTKYQMGLLTEFWFYPTRDSSNALRELFNNHMLNFYYSLELIFSFLNGNQDIFASVFTGLITLALIIYRFLLKFSVKIDSKVNNKNIVMIFKNLQLLL